MKKIIFGVNQIPAIISQHLIPLLNKKRIFAFRGPLGAGKTTCIKEFFAQLGVDEVVTSPTFTYVNTYQKGDGKTCYHFDLYRLDTVDAFLQLGFDEYLFDRDAISVIEWPEIIDSLLYDAGLCIDVCFIWLRYVEGDLEKREMEILFAEKS